MERLTRWLVLIVVTSATLASIAALIIAASPSAVAQHPGSDRSWQEPLAFRPPPLAVLEPTLAKALATAAPDQRLNIIVEMRERVAPSALVSGRATDLSARRRMVSVMQSTAERTQAGLRAYLAMRMLVRDVTGVIPFWIFNGLAVNGARPDIVRELSARPDVALIRLDHQRRWIEPQPAVATQDTGDATRNTQVEWGVERVRADEVWNTLGVSGTGVVVATVDTGVDWLHPALQASYRGYSPKGFHQHAGNWYDATNKGALYPVDGHGHGSHTMGTLVGGGGIGVAPGARWIAVRAFRADGVAFDSWLHAGFEWLLAPNGDPALAPQVVNNSWGNDSGALKTFQRDVDALRAAGIFVLFSAGNAGPVRGTVGSPASLPGAFTVGASDKDDEVTVFSSRGPSPWGALRPHVVAPGVNIYSTWPGGAYGEMQGTSMAAPHVAGTVALMLSAAPNLNITQTAFVLTSTAVPLTDSVPNNDTGYGRIDAYAAVALAANSGLISGTVYGTGVPLPDATVYATPALVGLEGSASCDDGGHYQLFLGAGHYDLVAQAFGYAPAHVHALSVIIGLVTVQDFDLTPLPTGHLQGMVTSAGGEKVEAAISVLGTPAGTTASGGSYQLDLPGGRYTLEARALGYRVVTSSVIVTAGQNLYHDFVLPESMRILLVDSGSWYYQSEASYYRQALDDLALVYAESQLKHLPEDTPTLTELLTYDLVIWSAPDDSPGLVGAGAVMTDYLGSGGNLLLSGQDVAFWDGGGTLGLQPYYIRFLHTVFRADNAPGRQVVCLDDSAFGGITLTIEGGDGADNQSWPDEIEVFHSDYASLACTYAGGRGAVIQAGFCSAHRALNLGFGFEAIDNAADRAAFMATALDWFASPRQVSGVELLWQTHPTQIAPPGGAVTHTLRLRNMGEAGTGDLIRVEVDGDVWPTTVLTPTVELDPCGTSLVNIRVDIPAGLSWNAFDVARVTAHSSVAPGLSQTLVFTSKVPAPVLLVDDDRWYDQEAAYEGALKANDVPYDRWEVTGVFGSGSPPAEVLTWFPVVLWFNGYDWFDPIHPNELDRLTQYLDGGGRLFLSSQDALYYIGSSEFAHEYLGVVDHTEVFSHTAVRGVPGHVLGNGLGQVDLTYPFRNWSDSVLPEPGSRVAFRGQHGQPGAVTREGACSDLSPSCHWRTAFFGFPVETLPEDVRETLISRLVGWLSWLGRSNLRAGRAVAHIGDTVGYTLVLRNDGPGKVVGATVSNTLPAGTTLVGGPDGGADYDAEQGRITWTGDLAPGAAVTFTYRLNLTAGTVHVPVTNTADFFLGAQGLHFQRHASVRIAAPDLSASSLAMFPRDASQPLRDASQISPTVGASTEVLVTLVVRNDGLDDAHSVRVDNPLPWPMHLITGTLSSSGGGMATELPRENRVLWEGEVAAGAPVTLTYGAIVAAVQAEGAWVYNAARLEDGLGGAWERGGWLYVEPHRWYFPMVIKDG